MKCGDDRWWCFCWDHKADTDTSLRAFHALLNEGRYIRQCIKATRTSYGQCPHLPRGNMCSHCPWHGKHHWNLPTQNIDNSRSGTLVGHMHDIQARGCFKHFSSQVNWGSAARRCIRKSSRIRAYHFHQFAKRLRWKRRIDHQHKWRFTNHHDRRQVSRNIIG